MGTLSGVVQEKAESAGDLVREKAEAAGNVVREQAEKAEQAALEQAEKAEQAEKELARQAKQAADNSVQQRQYHRALEIMQGLMQGNPLGKQFEEFTKKLQDIDAIANPHQP